MNAPRNRDEARAALFAELRRAVPNERVLSAMERVPREFFVPPDALDAAYENIPLSIGAGQTISQPLIVALMTSALAIAPTDTILEVGTGTGYQAAILAELAARVVTIERLPELVVEARRRLDALRYRNVRVLVAAWGIGWPSEAPYDGIIVAAAAPTLPEMLVDQLATGGRLVVPVGGRGEQDLIKLTRGNSEPLVEELGPCRFVPLIGPGAWPQ